MKKINAHKLYDLIAESDRITKIKMKIVPVVMEVLEKFEGKKITKRIISELNKREELQEFHTYLDKNYGVYQIKVYGTKLTYNDCVSITLGYKGSNDFVDMKYIKDCNIGYLNMKPFDIDSREVLSIAMWWNDLVERVEEFEKNNDKIMFFIRQA